MVTNIIRVGLSVYSIYQMAQFARPKLMAYDISVKTFNQLGEVLHIDGAFFMYFTGVVEAVIAALLGVSLITLFTGNKRFELIAATTGNGLLFCTMAGALLCEFFVRAHPVHHLVVLGTTLLIISVMQLLLLSAHRLFSLTIGYQEYNSLQPIIEARLVDTSSSPRPQNSLFHTLFK